MDYGVCCYMQDFYGASAGKSWLTVVNRSSHTEFLDAGPILNRIIAGLCGASGHNSFQVPLSCHAPARLHNSESRQLSVAPHDKERVEMKSDAGKCGAGDA